MSIQTSAALGLHQAMSYEEIEEIRTMLAVDARAAGITGRDTDLARMMHEIGVNRGFYDESADTVTSRTAMSLVHIMGEIQEFQSSADDLHAPDLEAAFEMADITILLLDMIGHRRSHVWASDLQWQVSRQADVDSDVVAITCAIGKLANSFYKTGEVDSFLAVDALNESIRIGQTYSEGKFRRVIFDKAYRNTQRKYRFGTKAQA